MRSETFDKIKTLIEEEKAHMTHLPFFIGMVKDGDEKEKDALIGAAGSAEGIVKLIMDLMNKDTNIAAAIVTATTLYLKSKEL